MNSFGFDSQMLEISSPPGDTLLETIEAIGMSQAELAMRMGRPLKTINEIIKGKAAITPETSLQLEKVLGIPASFWNNRERQYRESLSRKELRGALENKIQWLQQIPVEEMIQLGWIKHYEQPVDLLEETLSFFGISSPDLWMQVNVEKYSYLQNSPELNQSLGSITAWLRKGELEAQQVYCEPFSQKLLKESLPLFRRLTLQSVQNFYTQLKELCNQLGIAFCIVPELRESKIRQTTRWLTNDKALIQISDHYQQDDSFWFSFFHALGHLLLHGKRDVSFEIDGTKDQKQQEADQFAMEQLVQANTLRTLLVKQKVITKEVIQQHAANIGISPGVFVGWLQREEIIGKTQFNDLKRALVWAVIHEDEEESSIETGYEEEYAELSATLPQPVNLQLDIWPGLSTGARQALLAAGFSDEAGRVDEKLFAEWAGNQLANVESAFTQGYFRDALADLENLIAVTRIGAGRSPALEAMIQAFNLISNIIRLSTQVQPEQDLFMQARQAIVEANRSTHDMMVSEARKQYSYAATRTESYRASNLLNQR